MHFLTLTNPNGTGQVLKICIFLNFWQTFLISPRIRNALGTESSFPICLGSFEFFLSQPSGFVRLPTPRRGCRVAHHIHDLLSKLQSTRKFRCPRKIRVAQFPGDCNINMILVRWAFKIHSKACKKERSLKGNSSCRIYHFQAILMELKGSYHKKYLPIRL